MLTIAAIDIGSNALRLAIAEVHGTDIILTYRAREAVRLGSDVFANGAIGNEKQEQLCEALFRFQNQLKNFEVRFFKAIATSAMREAKNQRQVVEKILQTTGIPIEVISGDEEARIVFMAIQRKVNLQQSSNLLIDIGGGSIELVVVVEGQAVQRKSFPLGTVRLLALFPPPYSSQQLEGIQNHFRKELVAFFKDLTPIEYCIGTGGNMDRFGKLSQLRSRPSTHAISLDNMIELRQQLIRLTPQQRIEFLEIRPDRADVIVPAAIATECIMSLAGSKKLLVPQVGLRDGLLFDLAKNKIDAQGD